MQLIDFFDLELISLADYQLKVASLLILFGFWIGVYTSLRIVKGGINRSSRIEPGKKYAVYGLLKYFSYVLALVISLQILGFNLSVLLAGSAALLVGVGLGMQNLFSDYMSGLILLIDSSIKVGDVIEINGLVCTVQEINLRTTNVLTRDDKSIILPNTELTRNQLINLTHTDTASRFEVQVGVDYSSDVDLVMQLLQQAVTEQTGVLKDPKPFVRFTDFGDSSLNFAVLFWSGDVFRVEHTKSELRKKIFTLFAAHKVQIPFPQRVVHIKKE